MRPRVTPQNELALEVWRFCEGWHPERLGLAVAYYEVHDVDMLLVQMLAINDAVSAYKAAQRKGG
jgi:hypothetical protein